MAYTSIIPVHRLDNSVDYVLDEKKSSRSQNADSLQAAVDYALNKDKTEQDLRTCSSPPLAVRWIPPLRICARLNRCGTRKKGCRASTWYRVSPLGR